MDKLNALIDTLKNHLLCAQFYSTNFLSRVKAFLYCFPKFNRKLRNISNMKSTAVEKAGSTLYTEIAQELELLKRQEIMALGGVVVE